MEKEMGSIRPIHKEAIILNFSTYALEKDGLAPLPNSVEDGRQMEEFLMKKGFKQEFVTRIPCPANLTSNPPRPSKTAAKPVIEKSLQEMVNTAKALSRIRHDSLFFVYYSGHGFNFGNGGLLACVPNFAKPKDGKIKRIYIDLMEWVRQLSTFERVYVVAFFDCCRAPLPHEDMDPNFKNPSYSMVGGHLFCIFSAAAGESALAKATDTMSMVTQSFLKYDEAMSKNRQFPVGFEVFPINLAMWPMKGQKAEILDKSQCVVDFTYKFDIKQQVNSVEKLPEDVQKAAKSRDIPLDKQDDKRTIELMEKYRLFKAMDNDDSGGISMNEIKSNLPQLGIAADYKGGATTEVKPNVHTQKDLNDIYMKLAMGRNELDFDLFVTFLTNIEPKKEIWRGYQRFTVHETLLEPVLKSLWQPPQAPVMQFDSLYMSLLRTIMNNTDQGKDFYGDIRMAMQAKNDGTVDMKSYIIFRTVWIPRIPVTRDDAQGLRFLKEVREVLQLPYYVGIKQRNEVLPIIRQRFYVLRISSNESRFCLNYPPENAVPLLIERESYYGDKRTLKIYIDEQEGLRKFQPYNKNS